MSERMSISDLAIARDERVAELTDALEKALGYLTNAQIDLETGRTKATAVRTIQGGISIARAALSAPDPGLSFKAIFDDQTTERLLIEQRDAMLAALKAIEKDADWTGKNAERQYAAMTLVRAAIAKATGEQP